MRSKLRLKVRYKPPRQISRKGHGAGSGVSKGFTALGLSTRQSRVQSEKKVYLV